VADVRREPHYHAHVAATASELCVPIKAGDRMLGVINAESDQLDAFSEDDERLLLTIAGQLAAALEHLRTEAARQSMVARMEILHAIDTALLSAQSPQAMAQAAADGLRRLIACQRVSITPFNFQTGQAVYLAVSSATPTFLPPNSVVTLEAFGEHIVNGLRRDEPYLIEDVLTAEVVSEVDRRHSADGIRAWLCTPLFYQGQLTGALNLGYTTPGAYTPEQISIAREVADQLSIALQHARLHAETSETLAREQRLNEFVRAISRRLDVPAVLETAVRLAAELIGAESGSLSLMSPRRDAIVEVYDFNPPRGMESHRLPYSRGLVWLTYRTGEPLLTEAYAQHPEALPEWAAAGLRAYLAVPVSAGENRLGVLTLYNRESARPFTQRDLALAESIGRQVAVAVENARLFAAEQRRVALLTALHETGLDLSAQLDLPALLQTIMERAAHLLGATMGGFYLMEPDGKTLRHVANLPAGELNLPVKIGEGAVGQVAQHAAPLIIEDYHSWPGRLTDDVPFCGVVSVPILWQGRVLGVISICDPQPERFGPDDVESVRLLAAQAAVAITNARLYTEQQHELAERKRAEQALEENERTLRALLDAATDPVFLLDLNGTFLALNQALAKEFGQTVDAITGSYAYGWLPPELARQRKAQLDEVIRTGRPVRFADNNVGWYDNSIFPVFDAHGRVVRLAVYTRDITEYKRAEAALRQREVILETVALAAEQFLKTSDWRADINAILEQLGQKTGASHVYIFENHVTADGLPVTSQRYEWTAPGLQPEIDNPAFQNVPLVEPGFERWTEALQRGEPFYGNLKTFLPGEAGFLTPRGIKALLDVPIYVEGVWWGIIGFDDCLTERDWSVVERDTLKVAASIISAAIQRQRAEDAIRQLNAELERRVSDRTAQLEAANKELEAFSYSVSHDLRAPLRAIGGFARILQDEHAAQLTPEAQRPLGRILDNARRMSQLIDDLLNLSRLTRAALRRQPISLSRLAHEVVAAHQQREPHRQIECLIAPDLSVYGDPNLLKIVLENLLGNAWKFTIHQSQGRIEVGRLTQPDGQPVYFVRDNGAGFDMRYADKLFGAFQRLHGAEEFEGTGIGLATVQRIIHRHGGRVWAEGAVGAGAMFYFTLGNE
jgi:PAS domain S-box-containing protein